MKVKRDTKVAIQYQDPSSKQWVWWCYVGSVQKAIEDCCWLNRNYPDGRKWRIEPAIDQFEIRGYGPSPVPVGYRGY